MFDKAFKLASAAEMADKNEKIYNPLSRQQCLSIASIIASRRYATAVERITVWLNAVSKCQNAISVEKETFSSCLQKQNSI